jgi:anti-sigma B factor antagonist
MAGWTNDRVRPATLTIDVGRSDGTYNLALRGILDLSTSERLDSAIDAALLTDARRVSVDLDGLDFVDSTGLATILRASRRFDGNGRLTMTRGTGEVAQLFKLTALDLVLPFD